jgi:CheY-like chemotaxis protein
VKPAFSEHKIGRISVIDHRILVNDRLCARPDFTARRNEMGWKCTLDESRITNVQQKSIPSRAQPADQSASGKINGLTYSHHRRQPGREEWHPLPLSSCDEFAICGEAGEGAEGLLKAAELRPDVILLDLSLPDKNGLEIVPGLRRELPKTRILVMSADDLALVLPRARQAGADGCVDKARIATDLLPALGRPFS